MIDWITDSIGVSRETQLSVLATVVLFLVVLLLRRAIRRVIMRRIDDPRLRYRWFKGVSYGAYALLAISVGSVWLRGLGSLATYLGLASAGLAIALQTVVLNFAGWIYLVMRRPFEVGDRIQVREHIGDVVDIGGLSFSLLEVGNWVDADQSSGRVIHVPNGIVFSAPVSSYNKGFRYVWAELAVMVTFESNWQAAKDILFEVVREASGPVSKAAVARSRDRQTDMMIYYGTLDPTVYTSVADSGVVLTMRFLSEPRQRRDLEQSIWEAVLMRFAECDDIDFAYPTVRHYDNIGEGKPGARAQR